MCATKGQNNFSSFIYFLKLIKCLLLFNLLGLDLVKFTFPNFLLHTQNSRPGPKPQILIGLDPRLMLFITIYTTTAYGVLILKVRSAGATGPEDNNQYTQLRTWWLL